MPIVGSDLIDLAGQLVLGEPAEVAVRASISRSYYAAFHAMLPVAETLPKSEKMPKSAYEVSHHELSERLREWKAADQAQQGRSAAAIAFRSMERARKLRIKADYKLDDRLDAREAHEQIVRAQQLVRHAATLRPFCGPRPCAEKSA